MRQQINLYQNLPQVSRYRVSKKLFQQLCGGLVTFIVMIIFIQFVYLGYLNYKLKTLQQTVIQENPQLIRQNAQKTMLGQALKKVETQLNALPLFIIPPCYFSNDLQSLAQASVMGVWLTEIHLSLEKSSITLNGKVISPILTTRWLRQLRATPCFTQQKISTFVIDQPSAQEAVNFTLSSLGKS